MNQRDDIAVTADTPLELLSLKAWEAARSGRYDQAAMILANVEPSNAPSDILHLLARLAVQKGELSTAEQLWTMALDKDPSDEVAKAALARLQSPWLAVAVVKRVAYLAGIAALLCLSGIGILALAWGIHPMPQATDFPILIHSRPAHPSPIQSPQCQSNNPPDSQQLTEMQPVAVSSALTPIPLVPGCSVSSTNREIRITPDVGLFAYRCDLADNALAQIEGIAAVLAPFASNHWIIVEGHTDTDPLPEGSSYQDNYELGFHRALTVSRLLQVEEGIPIDSVLATSIGDRQTPFPNDDDSSKARNRTVTFRLVPNDTISTEEVIRTYESSR